MGKVFLENPFQYFLSNHKFRIVSETFNLFLVYKCEQTQLVFMFITFPSRNPLSSSLENSQSGFRRVLRVRYDNGGTVHTRKLNDSVYRNGS